MGEHEGAGRAGHGAPGQSGQDAAQEAGRAGYGAQGQAGQDAGDGGREASAEERFEVLIDDVLGIPGVTPPRSGRGFGRSALRVDNKIFAMLVRGRLVLKLPRPRVDTLIAPGRGFGSMRTKAPR